MDEFCPSVSETLAYYKLDSLVYLERDINSDLVSEFYNNLHQTSDGSYKTRVAKRTIDFSIVEFFGYLGCRMCSGDPFPIYPDLLESLPLHLMYHLTLSMSISLDTLDRMDWMSWMSSFLLLRL